MQIGPPVTTPASDTSGGNSPVAPAAGGEGAVPNPFALLLKNGLAQVAGDSLPPDGKALPATVPAVSDDTLPPGETDPAEVLAEGVLPLLSQPGEPPATPETLPDTEAAEPQAEVVAAPVVVAPPLTPTGEGEEAGEPALSVDGGRRALPEPAFRSLPQNAGVTRATPADGRQPGAALPEQAAAPAQERFSAMLAQRASEQPVAERRSSPLDGLTPARGAEGALPSVAAPLPLAQSSASVSPTSQAPIPVPPGQPGWDEAVGERLQWLVRQGSQQAEIHLNPPELGPLKVRVALEGDQVSVHFGSHHAHVREAVEAALPRLREMLADQGLNLQNVNVNAQGGGQERAGAQQGSAGGSYSPGFGGNAAEEGDEPAGGELPVRTGQGLLDTYA